MGLDVGWQETAWAAFTDDRDGPLEVVCRLAEDGDLDVTVRPKLEGQNIREHARLPQALAALAFVNPARAGDGEPVSRASHRGDWYQINDDLAVAVAGSGGVGGVDVGGSGAFLVFKGHLWLPNGVQEPREARPASVPAAEEGGTGLQADGTRAGGNDADVGIDAAKVRVLPRARAQAGQDRRARIFGDEADNLISQARSAGRRRA